MRGVYIGVGNDYYPLFLIPQIKEWVFVESMPQSEGSNSNILMLNENYKEYPKDYNKRKTKYLEELSNTYSKIGYALVKEESLNNLLIYKNKDKVIYYFYNTIFPDTKCERLYNLIKSAQNLYLSGFSPDKYILSCLSYPLTLYISSNMNLLPKKNITDDIIWFLYENKVLDISYVLIRPTLSFEMKKLKEEVRNIEYVRVSNLLEAHYSQFDKKYLNYLKSVDKDSYLIEPKEYRTGNNIVFPK